MTRHTEQPAYFTWGQNAILGTFQHSSTLTDLQSLDQTKAKAQAFVDSMIGQAKTYAYEGVNSFLTQSDVVVNKVDDLGWRKPSPYTASWQNGLIIARPDNLSYIGVSNRYVSIGKHRRAYSAKTYRGDLAIVPPLPEDSNWPGFTYSANTENELLARALGQAKDQVFDLALATLEARESFASVGSVLKKLRAVFQAIAKKDISVLQKEFGFKTKHYNSKTRTYTKDAGSLWLEALYGVMPIILDLYGICELISKDLREKDFLLVARAKSTASKEVGDSYAHPVGLTNGYNHVWSGQYDVTQKVALWYVLKGSELNLAASLGLTNPLLWVWEKTTLSFVVDWLIPIGDVISSLDADLGFQFKGGAHTFHSSFRAFCTYRDFPEQLQINGKPTEFSSGDELKTSNVVDSGFLNRKVYLVSPKPSLFVKDPFSVAHVVTTIALIAGKTSLRKQLR